MKTYLNTFKKISTNFSMQFTNFFCNSNKTLFSSFNQFSVKKMFSTPVASINKVYGVFPEIKNNTIWDNPGARKKRKILGRGPGNGKGKTSGKGHKGMQRSYKPPVHIQGGQAPLQRIMPKFGKTRDRNELYSELNIDKVHYLITKKRLDASKPITIKDLCRAGAVSNLKNGIKLLGKGLEKLNELPPLNITVTTAAESVIKKITELGGTIFCQFRGKLALRYEVKPYRFIKPINDRTPSYRRTMYYLKLEKLGAKVLYKKPIWMVNGQYQRLMMRIENMRKLINEQPDAEILPQYPVDRSSGSGLKRTRVCNQVRARKITYEKQLKG
jgi:large subunit ribosomal protein L15